MNLFLDDDPSRIPHKLSWVELPLVEWTIVRSYKQFVETILQKGIPNIVSFDHDLGPDHYKEFHQAWYGNKVLNYNSMGEKTGFHCAKWLIEYCMDKKLPLPTCYIHTQNPIGKQNIQSLLDSYRKSCKMES